MRHDKTGTATTESQQSPLGRRLFALQLASCPAVLTAPSNASAEPLPQAPAIPIVTDADRADGPGRGRPRGT